VAVPMDAGVLVLERPMPTPQTLDPEFAFSAAELVATLALLCATSSVVKRLIDTGLLDSATPIPTPLTLEAA
jgi:hypothetical protein